jgi:hypothetical protein
MHGCLYKWRRERVPDKPHHCPYSFNELLLRRFIANAYTEQIGNLRPNRPIFSQRIFGGEVAYQPEQKGMIESKEEQKIIKTVYGA